MADTKTRKVTIENGENECEENGRNGRFIKTENIRAKIYHGYLLDAITVVNIVVSASKWWFRITPDFIDKPFVSVSDLRVEKK